jgi:hypothetical protein
VITAGTAALCFARCFACMASVASTWIKWRTRAPAAAAGGGAAGGSALAPRAAHRRRKRTTAGATSVPHTDLHIHSTTRKSQPEWTMRAAMASACHHASDEANNMAPSTPAHSRLVYSARDPTGLRDAIFSRASA